MKIKEFLGQTLRFVGLISFLLGVSFPLMCVLAVKFGGMSFTGDPLNTTFPMTLAGLCGALLGEFLLNPRKFLTTIGANVEDRFTRNRRMVG